MVAVTGGAPAAGVSRGEPALDYASRALLAALRGLGVADTVLQRAADLADESGRPLIEILVDERVVTEFQIARAIADVHGVDAVELATFAVDSAAITRVPHDLARRHRMVPVAVAGDVLVVATRDPGDVVGLDDVRAATGSQVRPVVVTADDMRRLLDRVARLSSNLDEAAAEAADDEGSILRDLAATDEDAPVVKFVSALLERAISSRASDIHIEPGEDELTVRMRIDGVLHVVDSVPRQLQSALTSRLKIMSGIDITERRVPQNGRITMTSYGRAIDLRTATLPTVWGEKIVLRVLDTSGIDLDLRKLGFDESNYRRFADSFRRPHGMVLATGPTGSGKSTTLYATLTEVSRPEINVITVEDPVEFRIPGISQVQVNAKAGLTFAAVLPAILRSDPDVVLIGEIRDRATAQLAVEAALTGHLVLSTLHTNDAASSLPRLIEMGIEPYLVGSALEGVLAQRLARRLCEWCKEPYEPTDEELYRVAWPAETLPVPEKLWQSVGCRSCAQTGFRGRLAICEVLRVSEDIERLAMGSAGASEIRRLALAEGMVPLRDDGLAKCAAGQTTISEVLRVSI